MPSLLFAHPQARNVADGIVATVAMMEPSKLPCYSRGNPVGDLRARFHLEMSDSQASRPTATLMNVTKAALCGMRDLPKSGDCTVCPSPGISLAAWHGPHDAAWPSAPKGCFTFNKLENMFCG